MATVSDFRKRGVDPSPEMIAEETAKLRMRREALDRGREQQKATRKRHYKAPMSKLDIANVEAVSTNELLDAVGMMLDASGETACIEDLSARWTLGGDPDDFDCSDEPAIEPFKPLAPSRQRFRSGL